jgi:chromosome segregation ATPase
MRTELAGLRGELHRASTEVTELRAKFAAAVDAVEAEKADADRRVSDAEREVRDAERVLFLEQLRRSARDHAAVRDELGARLGQLQQESEQVDGMVT